MLPADYRERVYAGWLGKCAGVRLGVPVENWTAAEIWRSLGEITAFLPLRPGAVFQPDDDTAFPQILIRALEHYGPDLTPQQIGETVLNLVADGRGTLWWGGYGRSTEHTAYANLAAGIPAPRSGSAALNGRWLAEQIGGQIFSDIWGLVAPNAPALAADLAARAASVTHDGAAVDGARFIGALVAAAFAERDPAKLIESGLQHVAADGDYARVVRAVVEFWQQHPADWRACLKLLAADWGPDRWGGPVHIIPNAGVVVLALLYGAGDFGRSIRIATMAGWDTDCNAGNVGAIIGVAVGLGGIGPEWRAPMNDQLVGTSVLGARNLTTIPQFADLVARLGDRVMGEQEPEPRPRIHFGYAGATQSLTLDGGVALRQVADSGGASQITLRELNKKREARVALPTYIHAGELSANNYGASFSPLVYPGQTIRATLELPADAPPGLLAALFVLDAAGGQTYQAPAVALVPGERHALSYPIPPLPNALLERIGIVFRTLGLPWSGAVLLRWLDWDGPPHWHTDFTQAKPEYGAVAGWTFHRGFWRLEDGAYHGSGAGRSESYTGDPYWTDLRLAVDLLPLAGAEHEILLRVGGARRSYAVGLGPDGTLRIRKTHGGLQTVASVAHPWQPGQPTRLAAEVVGDTIAVSVDGVERLRWRDDEPLLAGAIGLATGPGCHTRFERVAIEGAAI